MTFGFEGHDYTVTFELITPDLAREYLTHNTHNRTLKHRSIAKYVSDMLDGNWQFTGATITFGANGVLLDGQNRLHAAINADQTIPCLVVRGVQPSAQMDMDTGNGRKFVDVLNLMDSPTPITNATIHAALVRKIGAWESGARRHLSKVNPSHAQLLAIHEKYPNLNDYASAGKRVSHGVGISPALAAFAWWLFDQIDTEDANHFFERLADGQGMSKGNPIFELRRTLAAASTDRGDKSQEYLLAITIKAWNAYREGRPMKVVSYRIGGASPERFPEAI